MAEQTEDLISIGLAAERTGVTPRTIRYYEEVGLITPIRPNGRRSRLFNAFHLKLISDIQQLASLGFALEEIRQIMALKRVFFDQSGQERRWRTGEVPLDAETLDALRRKTLSVMENIRSQEAFLERVSSFLSMFISEQEEQA